MLSRHRTPLVALIGLLLAAVVGCGAATAEVTVALRDPAGRPLAGLDVALGEHTAQTDADGLASFADIAPAELSITITGRGYDVAKQETIAAGNTQLDYTLNDPWLVGDLSALTKYRYRLSQGGEAGEEILAKALIDGPDAAHWDFGDTELVLHGPDTYLLSDGVWAKADDYVTSAIADVYRLTAEGYLADLLDLAAPLGTPGLSAEYVGVETLNGFGCKVFDVSVPSDAGADVYRAYVTVDGPHAGLLTRLSYDVAAGQRLTIDIWDFDGGFTVLAPI